MTKEDALKKIAEKQQYQYKENIYKLEVNNLHPNEPSVR